MTYQWASCRYAGPMKPGYEDRAIPENPAERATIPDDVLVFPEIDSWREHIWALISDIVTDDVRQAFMDDPPDYVVSDDLSWLNEIVFAVTRQDVEMKAVLAERLPEEYSAFRAAHATRTDDLSPFYEHGLRCLRADEVGLKANALFATPEFGWVDEARFEAAVADVGARKVSGGREGRLYFCVSERSLITRLGGSGHYLIYGSEYLYCLGIRLVSRHETQRVLKSVGRPTMFVCDIPLSIMRPTTLEEFAGSILESLFCELIGEKAHALSPSAGSALSLTKDMPAEHIVGHCHPARIHDPL